MSLKRKYFAELNRGHRIDLFLDGDFRIVTSIDKFNEQDCMVRIQNYEAIQSRLETLKSRGKLKGIYYKNEEVYGFETEIKSAVDGQQGVIINRPIDFFKVQRRQHVRVNWFSKVDFLPVDNLSDYKFSRFGQLMKGNQFIAFEENGFMLNLSGGGMELKTTKPIDSEFIICRFKFKGEYHHYFAAKRRVTEVQELGRKTYRIGFEFINLTKAERERTIKIVFEKMREIQRKRLG